MGASPGERRILLIADLSGYTGYLMAGEIEEAPLIAGHLVETMLDQLSSEFEIAGLEGDAAFVHAPVGTLTGDGLLAAIARSHRAFRQRIESLRQATTCECQACRRVPTLDLKFFVHVGEVIRQQILGRNEIAGRDVILVHRLLKDSQPAREGQHRFALLTDAAVRALGIDPASHGMRPVTQTYDHLGEIAAWTGPPRPGVHPRPSARATMRGLASRSFGSSAAFQLRSNRSGTCSPFPSSASAGRASIASRRSPTPRAVGSAG